MHSICLTISGYVQGVGFRLYVGQSAKAMGVQGEVWNGRDRAVHVIAQHNDEAVLRRFEEEMWRGPGRVDEIRAEPCEPRLYEGFGVSASR